MEYYVFKHPYLLVEDDSGRHRPFYREYSKTKELPGAALKEKKREKEKRPGGCEICVVKYSNYSTHIKEEEHRRAAEETNDYSALDSLVEKMNKSAGKGIKKKLFHFN